MRCQPAFMPGIGSVLTIAYVGALVPVILGDSDQNVPVQHSGAACADDYSRYLRSFSSSAGSNKRCGGRFLPRPHQAQVHLRSNVLPPLVERGRRAAAQTPLRAAGVP